MTGHPISSAPSHGQVVFVADAGHVARAFRSGQQGAWMRVNEASEPALLDFEPSHWGHRLADVCAERERGGECELCGRPVEVGQVVYPFEEPGEVHVDCHNPYRLAYPICGDGVERPTPVVLLGQPMRHFALPEKEHWQPHHPRKT